MFTLAELQEDPTLLIDLKEDTREECKLLGEVTNVTLYDVRTLLPWIVQDRCGYTPPCER